MRRKEAKTEKLLEEDEDELPNEEKDDKEKSKPTTSSGSSANEQQWIEVGHLSIQQVLQNMPFGQHLQPVEGDRWRWDQRSWQELNPSEVVQFDEDGFSVLFHPKFAVGTAAVRGDLPMGPRTLAYWEVCVDDVYGSSMMFGIGTEHAVLSTPLVFANLLGGGFTALHSDAVDWNVLESCGLSHRGVFFHDGAGTPFCAPFEEGAPCRVGCLFDGPRRALGFALNGRWLGWAIRPGRLQFGSRPGLALQENRVFYYPMMASTAQRSRFSLVPDTQILANIAPTLQEVCQQFVVDQLLQHQEPANIPSLIAQLGLPEEIRVQLVDKCAIATSSRSTFGSGRMGAKRLRTTTTLADVGEHKEEIDPGKENPVESASYRSTTTIGCKRRRKARCPHRYTTGATTYAELMSRLPYRHDSFAADG